MKNDGVRAIRPCTFYSLDRRLQIIVIKLDELGDFVVAIPALTRLREKFKEADIDIIIGEGNAHLAKELKYFRNVYTCNLLNGEPGTNHTGLREEELIATLGEFDIAIDLRRHGEARFLLSKISALLKVGYRSFSQYDSELDICLHAEIEQSGRIKESDKYHMSVQLVRLIDSIPGGFIDLPKLCDLDPVRTQVAIFPKAGNDAREWPIEYFVELCRAIIDEDIADALNLYLPKDQSDASDKFGQIPHVQVHTGLSMKDLISSLIQNGLTITNNSFGGHISSYLGMTTVAIYSGHELVSQWGPAFGNTTAIFSEVSCAPCHTRLISDCPYDTICLKQIKPDYVFDMVRDELEKSSFRDTQFKSRRYFVY